jgi:hypothetical protein
VSKVGRSEDIGHFGYALGFVSWGIDVVGYNQQGDPWWKATVKGSIEAGNSLLFSAAGTAGGVAIGTAMIGPNLAGVPEFTVGTTGR